MQPRPAPQGRTDGDEVADGGQVQRQDAAGAPAQQAELVAAVLALLPRVLHAQRTQVKHMGGAVTISRTAPTCTACTAHQVKHTGGALTTDLLDANQGDYPLPQLATTQLTCDAGSRCGVVQTRLQCICTK